MVTKLNIIQNGKSASFDIEENSDGSFILASDYEALKAERDALEQRVNALAVENAGLMTAVTAKTYVDFIKSNGWNAGAKTINGKFAGFMDPEVDFGSMTFEHAKKLIDAVATPATDAALAAVRAQGVEQFIAEMLERGNDPTNSLTERVRADMRSAATFARLFIELREGK